MNIFSTAILLLLASDHSTNALSCLPCEEDIFDHDTGLFKMVKKACPKLDCPGAEVPGVCPCCNRCAKQIGESCGGEWNMEGDCEPHLACAIPELTVKTVMPLGFSRGTCRKPVSPVNCAGVCKLTDDKNNNAVGMSTYGRSEYFDYKPDENSSDKGTWFYCDCIGREVWMIAQRRSTSMESFDRDLTDYINGFGVSTGDYWMGLKALNYFTSEGKYEMKITVKLDIGIKISTFFSEFSVGDEKEDFKLHVKEGHTDASKKFAAMHDGMKFSARDSDNDKWVRGNCAEQYGGGWWFNRCTDYNLNGVLYSSPGFSISGRESMAEDGPDRVSWGPCFYDGNIVETEIAIRPSQSSSSTR